jgi:hypothetical protein
MMSASSGIVPLLVSFVGGSFATYLIQAFVSWRKRPIIVAKFVERSGCYAETRRGNNPAAPHKATFLRLIIENVGKSKLEDCTAYITRISKRVGNLPAVLAPREVITLKWSHGLGGGRDIPRNAFFFLDVISLEQPAGGARHLALSTDGTPNTQLEILNGAGHFEFTVLVAAGNAKAEPKRIEFRFDPQSAVLDARYDSGRNVSAVPEDER